MLSLLRARSTLSLSGAILPRPALALSSRAFSTTIRLELAAATKTKTKSKAAPAKKPAAKKPAPKKAAKKAVAKPKKVTKKVAKPKAPVFDKKLMTPPKKLAYSPYSVYMSEHLKEYQNGGKATENLKEAAQAFASLSEAQKQPYVDKCQPNLEINEKRYSEWYSSLPEGYWAEIQRRRKAKGKPVLKVPKDVVVIKRPAGPYIQFYKEFRLTHPITKNNLGEVSKAAGEAWKSLGEGEKQKYVLAYRDAVEEYNKIHAAKKIEVN